MKRRNHLWLLAILVTIPCAYAQESFWTADQIHQIDKLSLAWLPKLRPDVSNRVADDPRAAELGRKFFFDAGFSANGQVSCSSCHVPDTQFQDGLRVGHGIADGTRRTMPLAGVAYYPLFFWDGRKDSLWSQALGPLENPVEHGADRGMLVQQIVANYREEYEEVFGNLPELGSLPAHAAPVGSPESVTAWNKLTPDQQTGIDRVFSNIGKAIEAFERTIMPGPTRFDAYAAALVAGDELTADKLFADAERNGLKLFIDKADCVRCHSGPLFTDARFRNLGLPGTTPEADSGQSTGAVALKEDPFNCTGAFSDVTDEPGACFNLNHVRTGLPYEVGAFKSPSLRGVAQRPPYLHNGQFATLREVLLHYNKAPKATFGTTELTHPLELGDDQLADIEAFLQTLNAIPSSQ
jgi:cytochrome c peroxidase